jgi:O-antigen/teichoic acid export membrane protein
MMGEGENGRRSLNSLRHGRWTNAFGVAAKRQLSDPLSRGGLALLINTALTAVLGFIYWIIAARLFSTYAVGVAGALVAATTLFSGLGQLNLSGMLMRFLPKADRKSRRLVLSTYTFAASASALLAVLSLAIVELFASPTSPLRLSAVQSITLVLAAAAMAIFTIEDNVLVGLRRAAWVPVENGAFGIAKIAILFILAPIGTAFALFGAWMIPVTLTIPVISAVLFFRFLPSASRPRRAAHLGPELRSAIIRFTMGDATGGLFTQAWMYLLPILVTASMGASANALFYTSFLFSSTIDQVAANYASPLTVEGAHAPHKIAMLIRQTFLHIYVIIVPVVTALIIISPWLLRPFGDKYMSASPLLDLLLIACLPKAVSTVYYAYCRLQRKTHRSAVIQAYVCIATISLVAFLARSLIAVGIVIVLVQSSACIFSWWALRKGLDVKRYSGRHGPT